MWSRGRCGPRGRAVGGDEDEPDEPRLLINIAHPHGVNGLCADAAGTAMSLYVADETDVIRCYGISA